VADATLIPLPYGGEGIKAQQSNGVPLKSGSTFIQGFLKRQTFDRYTRLSMQYLSIFSFVVGLSVPFSSY